MNDLADAPPNVQALRLLSPDGVPAERPSLSPLNLEVSDDPFHRLDSITQAIKCDHPTLGLKSPRVTYAKAISLASPQPRPPHPKYAASFTIVFAPDRYIPVSARLNDSPLHLSVDQLRLIDLLRGPASAPSSLPVPNATAPEPRIAITMHEPLPHDQLLLMMRSLNTTAFGTEEEQALGSFTRRKLQRLSNWKDWQLAEAKQLDSMAKQRCMDPPSTHLPRHYSPPALELLHQGRWNSKGTQLL
ncbi:hypothetical protein MHU86_13643 [Fragilaria crotonensis]|nr:hypothetical protein MHU86_13643 [Fragilaria crotonensis]